MGGIAARTKARTHKFSGLDFVAKKSSLTISNDRKARRGCAALLGSRLDHHAGETRVLQPATDQCRIVVAVRRACRNLCASIRHIIRKYILLDAIPNVEQKMSSGLQDSLCFAVGRCAARGDFQNGAWREGRCSLCKICGERARKSTAPYGGRSFPESSRRTPCPFPTLLSPWWAAIVRPRDHEG
jgi:hypothetical protein